jgi:putative two-component system response regulator
VELIRHEEPDTVLLDLMMPEVNGFDILKLMRRNPILQKIPVVVLTAAADASNKLQALELGATDFLAKPVDPSELVLRLRNTLEAKAYKDHLEDYSAQLEQKVTARTTELEAARHEALLCLARAAEYRDDDTGHHVVRVGRYAAIVARELGFETARIDLLEQAAQLHDVGKIGIPDSILLKPDKLTTQEFDFMKQHCAFGQRIMQPAPESESNAVRGHAELGARIIGTPSSPVLRLAAVIATTHHERWDGTGYPHGLAGTDIPIEGRITAVADVFDALSSERPYKPAFPREKCFKILEDGRGTQFDPDVLTAFFSRWQEIVKVQMDYND